MTVPDPAPEVRPNLVLVRHGQSAWNLENRFTGWWDVDLTERGMAEARAAGRALRALDLSFDLAVASVQTRAIRTLHLILDELDRLWVPEIKDWRFNERHYGGLTGLDKAETARRHGQAQVLAWRRSFDVPPPPLEPGSPYDLAADPRYRGVAIPTAESLKDTIARVIPAFDALVVPALAAGQRVLVAAHGNSLRALVKHLSGISDADILAFEIPTGTPILYTLGPDLVVHDRRFLECPLDAEADVGLARR